MVRQRKKGLLDKARQSRRGGGGGQALVTVELAGGARGARQSFPAAGPAESGQDEKVAAGAGLPAAPCIPGMGGPPQRRPDRDTRRTPAPQGATAISTPPPPVWAQGLAVHPGQTRAGLTTPGPPSSTASSPSEEASQRWAQTDF